MAVFRKYTVSAELERNEMRQCLVPFQSWWLLLWGSVMFGLCWTCVTWCRSRTCMLYFSDHTVKC